MVGLTLQERGQLSFPDDLPGWRLEPHSDAGQAVPGPRLCWRSVAPGRHDVVVQVILPSGPPRTSEDILVACAAAQRQPVGAFQRLIPVRFGDSVRLAGWISAEPSGAVTLALAGSACEVVLTASGLGTTEANLEALQAVAAHGRFSAVRARPGEREIS